jgi:hypothetical protein
MISLSRDAYFGEDLCGVWAVTRKGVANPTTITAIAAVYFLILPISKLPNAIVVGKSSSTIPSSNA